MGYSTDLAALMRKPFRTAAGLFFIVFGVHVTSFVSAQGDSRWTIPQALSLIQQHNFDLDEYANLFPAHDYYLIECVSGKHQWTWPVNQAVCPAGHFYYMYPPAVSVAAVPFVLAIQAAVHVLHPILPRFTAGGTQPWATLLSALLNEDLITGSPIVEILIASFFIALAAAVLFFALPEFVSEWEAARLALTFAFCTSGLSIASRSLAAHAPSMPLNNFRIPLP